MKRSFTTPVHSDVRRRGITTPAVAFALIVLLCALALVLDRVWLDTAKTELSTASEAAALAAAGELANDETLKSKPDWASRIVVARRKAEAVAAANPVAGDPVALRAEDVRIGRWVHNRDENTFHFLDTNVHPKSVMVTGQRTRSRNNPVALFLRNLTGHHSADVTTPVEASVDNRVIAVRPFDGGSVPAFPLAIYESDPGDRVDTWQRQIEQKLGQDNYGFNPETKQVTREPDGLPEIILHSRKRDEEATESNIQLIDLNTNLRTDPLVYQIKTGWTKHHLKQWGGELPVKGNTQFTSWADINDDISPVLRKRVGEPRICLLYSSVAENGRQGFGRLTATRLVAGRIMAVRRTDDNGCEIVLQPAVVSTRTAVLSTFVKRPDLENPYIYKIHLTK